MKRINGVQIKSISDEMNHPPPIINTHTDNVSLKNQSEVEYKCHEWAIFSFYCFQIDIEWGGGSTSFAEVILIYDAPVYMEAGACVDNNGGHKKVHFSYDTEHKVKNVFGNTKFKKQTTATKVCHGVIVISENHMMD